MLNDNHNLKKQNTHYISVFHKTLFEIQNQNNTCFLFDMFFLSGVIISVGWSSWKDFYQRNVLPSLKRTTYYERSFWIYDDLVPRDAIVLFVIRSFEMKKKQFDSIKNSIQAVGNDHHRILSRTITRRLSPNLFSSIDCRWW